MAIRTRAVYPDVAYTLPNGDQIGVVSEEALLEETVAMLRVAYRLGGLVQVVQDRAATGVPHEMVTVGALIQWQDRTDAKPQPEPAVEPQVVEVPDDDLRPGEEWTGEPEPEEVAALDAPLGDDEYEDDDPEPEELEERLEEEAAREEREDAPLPEGAVVMGAPVGANISVGAAAPAAAAPPPTEAANVHVDRESGQGAGALPFQKGDQPGDPPRPTDFKLSDIAHGDASSLPRGDAVPAPAGSSEGIDDGFVPEADEDLSAIPEHLRG